MIIANSKKIFFNTIPSDSKKILLVANTGWYLYNFRLPLAQYLRNRGIQVVFVSPWDEYVEKIQEEGFWWIEFELIRRSTNPFLELYSIFRLILIYLVEKPSIVHHFTIKCVLYGSIAARLAGVKSVVNAITGLGYIFINRDLKAIILRRLLKPLYRFVLKAKRGKVIFQNTDDLNTLKRLKLVSPEYSVLIRSSGVDSQRFAPCTSSLENSQIPTVLLASRLIADKGIYEYVEASRKLKSKGYKVRFLVAGALYPGNPSAIYQDTLKQWCNEGLIDWLGHIDRMENTIALSDIVVLPSHGGEGVPKILLEGAAMGKPLIATDVPGCRDVIDSGKNGFLVPVKNSIKLANAIERLLKNPELCQKMGMAGREKVVKDFDVNDVIHQTAQVYQEMGIFSQPLTIHDELITPPQYI